MFVKANVHLYLYLGIATSEVCHGHVYRERRRDSCSRIYCRYM